MNRRVSKILSPVTTAFLFFALVSGALAEDTVSTPGLVSPSATVITSDSDTTTANGDTLPNIMTPRAQRGVAPEVNTTKLFGKTFREAEAQDYVYLIPASLGGTVGSLVGNVIGWPIKIVARVAQGDISRNAFVPPGIWSERFFGTPMAYVVGSPFWAMEQLFWELPAKAFSSETDHRRELSNQELAELENLEKSGSGATPEPPKQ